MRKINFIVAAALGMTMILTGCSGNASEVKSTEHSKKPQTITVLRSEHPSQPLRADAPSLLQIEKIKGIKIDLQSSPLSDFGVKLRTLLTTNRMPDVAFVKIPEIREFANTGMFLDLTPYWENGKLPNLRKALEKHPDYKKILVNGKLYGFPNLDREEMYYGQYPMIRTDILKKLNLPMPTSFEELYQTLKKMKTVYPDSYPWTMRWGINSQFGYLAYSFGSGFATYYEPVTQKYQYGPIYPEFKNMIVYLKKLYDEKLLDPNYATNTAQQWQQNLSSGKSLFYYDNNMFGVNFIGALKKLDKDAMFDMVPVLKNDQGVRRAYRYPSGHIDVFYAISSKVKDPDRVVELFDWFYSEEGADITNYGIPGEHFTRTKEGVTIKPELLAQFKDKAEPAWALLSYLGTGFQGFGPYADETIFQNVDPQMITWAEAVKKMDDEGILRQYEMAPPFTNDETEKLKDLNTKVSTIANQNYDKFIMGDRPISEWNNFVKELTDAGAKEIEKIYNTAYERLKQ